MKSLQQWKGISQAAAMTAKTNKHRNIRARRLVVSIGFKTRQQLLFDWLNEVNIAQLVLNRRVSRGLRCGLVSPVGFGEMNFPTRLPLLIWMRFVGIGVPVFEE